MRETKKEKVIRAVEEGDFLEAMKIAKSFHIELSKEENTIVRRAYEMYHNKRFYEQLGFNLEEEWDKAVNILINIYLKK